MRELMMAWYGVLNSLYVAVQAPFAGLTADTDGTFLTALLLGVLGAASPCQLSTNASSIAYVLQGAGRQGQAVGWSAAAYVAGKAAMYSGFGLLAVLMGQGLQAAAIPTVVVARKLLGPLMILIALAMLRVWRPRWGFGHRLSLRFRERVGAGGVLNAFLLGVAFSLAFCPTLALLFFGYVVPLTVSGAGGVISPAAFAVGTTFPLLLATVALMVGVDTAGATRRIPAWGPWLRRAAGVIFLLAGLNDTLLYWFL